MWYVRKAELEDVGKIVELAKNFETFLMPYVLNEFVVRGYINHFLVAEEVIYIEPFYFEVGGAVHYIDTVDSPGLAVCDKACSFLHYIKQVPEDVIEKFILSRKKVAFLGQIVCPGRGSFYAILEELKRQYDELWCWMSVAGPSYKSYERYGFQFSEKREFWNVYKCGYSTFVLGNWIKETNGYIGTGQKIS